MEQPSPELLKRYADHQCTDAERHLVEAWLDSEDQGPQDPEPNEQLKAEIWEKLDSRRRLPERRVHPFVYPLAAACLLGVAIVWFFRTNSVTGHDAVSLQTYQAPQGHMSTITLADGTTVQLAGGSTLRYPADFGRGERKVKLLSGKAFFRVAHDAAHPFLVAADQAKVRVLGTHFCVDLSGAQQLSVTLTQGSIRFEPGSSSAVLLRPGEQLQYDRKAKRVYMIAAVDTNYAMAWTAGVLWFKQTPVKKVFNELAKTYGVHFVIVGHPVLDVPLTGRFDHKPLSAVLNLIEHSTSLAFRISGDQVYVEEQHSMNN